MSKLIIVRGLPGSGKTTIALEIAAQTGAMLIEPDALLVYNGEYQYTPERYQEACFQCEAIIEMLTACDNPLDDGSVLVPDIIYADVLPRRIDVHSIIDLYVMRPNVEVIDCIVTPKESLLRNQHNVRPEDIKRMAEQWEDWV